MSATTWEEQWLPLDGLDAIVANAIVAASDAATERAAALLGLVKPERDPASDGEQLAIPYVNS